MNWKFVQRKKHINFDEREKSLFGENEAGDDAKKENPINTDFK